MEPTAAEMAAATLARLAKWWMDYMPKPRASLCLLPLALIAPQAHAAKKLSVNFTISSTNGFNGVDPASLTVSKGTLSGTVTVITPDGTFPCTVNSGSTDLQNHLHLICTIGPAEMVTLAGKLNPSTEIGRGRFSESFFKEQGIFRVTKTN